MEKFLDYNLFRVGGQQVNIGSMLFLLGFYLIIAIILLLIRKLIFKNKEIEYSRKYSIYKLVMYFVIIISIFTGFEMIGIKMSMIWAGSAALLVGIGLGLQNLFSDFISGIILLFDSSVRVGDIIETNGMICAVKEINIRTTTVISRDDKELILPNTILTKNELINWTHGENVGRFKIDIGVSYHSDPKQVSDLLLQALKVDSNILAYPEPFTRLEDFGDSSIDFSVFFWTSEIFRVERIKSNIRFEILRLFNMNSIEIPFPQRVIHQQAYKFKK